MNEILLFFQEFGFSMQDFWLSAEKILTPANIFFLLKGASKSLAIATGALILGTVLGIFLAAARISTSKILKVIATIYVEIIRGTPMLLQILFFYLAVPNIYRLVTGSGISFDPYLIGLTAMSFNSGAYSSELIRASILSIDKGQWEAGKSLGMSYFLMMKSIILPQAFKRILPPLVNEFIVLIKDSSLIYSIGAIELLQSSKILGARYYNYIVPLLAASIIYLTMTLTISFFASKLERRLSQSD